MRKRIQVVLYLGIAVAAIRLAWILYERHQNSIETPRQQSAPINPDYYVVPRKLYPYDLKSARQLTQQPVWVKVGYAYPYFRYNPATHKADLSREAGRLLPLQRLDIKDVVLASAADAHGKKRVLAVFQLDGKSYASPIGSEQGGDYKFFSDDMLFVQDPHDLYKHWPPDVWLDIDQHKVKEGMSEMQTDFALGIGLLQPGSDDIDRTLDYPNGGNPLKVSFHHDKAIRIAPGATD